MTTTEDIKKAIRHLPRYTVTGMLTLRCAIIKAEGGVFTSVLFRKLESMELDYSVQDNAVYVHCVDDAAKDSIETARHSRTLEEGFHMGCER